MAKALVITEKPSVARDITAVLGGFTEHEGYWENDDFVVTFAVGHLFELLPPEEVDEKFKRWTLDVLPMIPEQFSLRKKKGQSDRIRVIKKQLERDDVDRVINACDAGREGELIFREIVKFLGSEKPIERLWLQSMTTAAIRTGFTELRPGSELDGLAAAAECRACTDWLIGMNATRALTKRLKSRKEKTAWSAGRVQTPTLALLVEREAEVLAHVPRAYWRVHADFVHAGETYRGTWYDPAFDDGGDPDRKDDRIFEEPRARAIEQAVRGQVGAASETRKPSKETAPPLFDLTSLQREGNRRFSWSARRALGAAQRCYEAHKILTYPRTDSRCLPEDYRETVAGVLERFAGATEGEAAEYAPHARRLLDQGLENDKRTFDDSKVSDHFAIIPTGNPPPDSLAGDDKRLFDLVMRRFLGNFHPPAQWERVERTTRVGEEAFRTRTRALTVPGWREVLPVSADEEASAPLPALAPGQSEADGVSVQGAEVEVESDETKPPPRLSEARLLSLMENAGKAIEDEELAAALSGKGLGTPATRADIIENLIAKSYAVRLGKALRPTVKGIRLIDTLKRVHIDRLASPQLTGEIEQHLAEVERGGRTADDFMREMKAYASEIVEIAKTFEYGDIYKDLPALGKCPSCGRDVYESAWFYRCVEQEGVSREDDCPMRFWKDTSGRYLDRRTISELLSDGKTGILDGFTARNGRTYKGVIELDEDEWKLTVRSEGWNDEAQSDIPEYEVNTEPLGRCPLCQEADLVETPTEFTCVARRAGEDEYARKRAEALEEARAQGKKRVRMPKPDICGWVLPRTVCKREITRDEALGYLTTGRTELLTDFTSRFGRPFSAILFAKETGRHGFEFPPRAGAKKEAAAEGDAEAPKTAGRKKKAAKGTTAKKAGTRRTAPKKKSAAKPARKAASSKKKASAKSPARKTSRKKKASAKKPPTTS